MDFGAPVDFGEIITVPSYPLVMSTACGLDWIETQNCNRIFAQVIYTEMLNNNLAIEPLVQDAMKSETRLPMNQHFPSHKLKNLVLLFFDWTVFSKKKTVVYPLLQRDGYDQVLDWGNNTRNSRGSCICIWDWNRHLEPWNHAVPDAIWLHAILW